MSRRSRRNSPFSLFAFQDIITSVTGIMILVTMMLALELIKRKEQIRRTREQLQHLKKSNRMIFNPTEGDQKTPWLVELDAGAITVAKVGESARPQTFSNVERFLTWSTSRNRGAEYFVLLVKPGSVESFDKVHGTLTGRGFDVGYDVMAADQTAIDPETGAAP